MLLDIEDGDLSFEVYQDLSFEKYKAMGGLNASLIKEAVHDMDCVYWNSFQFNKDLEEKETKAQSLGTALHKFILEGQKPDAVCIEKVLSGDYELDEELQPHFFNKEGVLKKPTAIKTALTKAGISYISARDDNFIERAKKNINESIPDAFRGGYPEVSVVMKINGIPFGKCRLDYLTLEGIQDLKTTSLRLNNTPVANKQNINQYALDYNFPIQQAWYSTILRCVRESPPEQVVVHGDDDFHLFIDEFQKGDDFGFYFVVLDGLGRVIKMRMNDYALHLAETRFCAPALDKYAEFLMGKKPPIFLGEIDFNETRTYNSPFYATEEED